MLKINIFVVRFKEGEGGSKKEYSLYARENVENCERPLSAVKGNT